MAPSHVWCPKVFIPFSSHRSQTIITKVQPQRHTFLGFNEGPGQALSFGKVWEGIGYENAATIGATFATIGFFFAFSSDFSNLRGPHGSRRGFSRQAALGLQS